MFKFTCCFLCAVAVTLTGVHAGENTGPNSIKDLDIMLLVCAKEHGVTDSELQKVLEVEDVMLVKPCFWACCFKKTGFLNDKGQYVLDPGLTYIRRIVKRDDVYTDLENVARQCESVKDKCVSDGKAGCERGLLIATCLMEQIDQIRFFAKTYSYNGDFYTISPYVYRGRL